MNTASKPQSIPPLKPHEGSYIIVSQATGQPVLELWRDDVRLNRLNTQSYRAVPIGTWLASLSKR